MLNRSLCSGNRQGKCCWVEREVTTGAAAESSDWQKRAKRQDEEQQRARDPVSQLSYRSKANKTEHSESDRQLIARRRPVLRQAVPCTERAACLNVENYLCRSAAGLDSGRREGVSRAWRETVDGYCYIIDEGCCANRRQGEVIGGRRPGKYILTCGTAICVGEILHHVGYGC